MSDPSRVLDEAYAQDGDPFAMSIPPPEGYRGYDYKPSQTPFEAFVKPWASSELAKQPPNWFGRNVLQPASKVPGLMEIAAFIGPKGAANLAKAGIRHPDDWGGSNRLRAAQQDMGWVRESEPARRAIWEKYGWTPPQTWGTHGIDVGKASPATVVATPRYGVEDAALSSMASGKDTIRRGEGRLADLTHGLDELFVAEPSLAQTPTKVTSDPKAQMRGQIDYKDLYAGGFKIPGQKPVGLGPQSIYAAAPNKDLMEYTLLHEIHHGAATPQGVTPPKGNQLMSPIPGTKAERMLQKQIDLVDEQIAAIPRGENLPMELQKRLTDLMALRNILVEKQSWVPSFSGYMNLADERLAREGALRGRATLDEHKGMVPGFVDTYQPGTLGSDFPKRNFGLPLSAFNPKTIKRPD